MANGLRRQAEKEALRKEKRLLRASRGNAALAAGAAVYGDLCTDVRKAWRARTDLSAAITERLWALVKLPLLGSAADCDGLTWEEGTALLRFYWHAENADVTQEHVTDTVARAFIIDKWAARCDLMCCALLCLSERSGRWDNALRSSMSCDELSSALAQYYRSEGSRHAKGSGGPSCDGSVLRVASIGGGPGNDACGFFVYNSLVDAAVHSVFVTVFDFSITWQIWCEVIGSPDVLESLSEGLAGHDAFDLHLSFALADLRAPALAEVNSKLLLDAPTLDFFLFSHVMHESQAASFELLPMLMRKAKIGAWLVFIDMYIGDMNLVAALAQKVEREFLTEDASCGVQCYFAVVPLGGTEDYNFLGIALRKHVFAKT